MIRLAMKEKGEQLTSLTTAQKEKEELIESLQKNNTELTSMIADLKTEVEVASLKGKEVEVKLREQIELATPRILELQNRLNNELIERERVESALQDARDQSVSLMNQLEVVKSKLSEVEMRSLEETE